MIAIKTEGKLISVSVIGEFTLSDYKEFEGRKLPTRIIQNSGQGDIVIDRAVEDRVEGRREGSAGAFRGVALAHAEIPVRWRACVQQKALTIN